MHAPEAHTPASGRAWAYLGFVLGIAGTVAGNIAHTWHPSATALAIAGTTADQWTPAPGAQAAAAFFPVALLIVVEILSRVRWARNWRSYAARYGGAGLVAAVAGIVSYLHLRGLLLAYGEDQITATIGPLSIDGLMIISGFALIAIGAAPEADTSTPAPPLHATPEYELSLLRDQPRLELDTAHAEDDRQDHRSPRRRRPALMVADSPAGRRRRPRPTAAVAPAKPSAPVPAPLEPDLLPLIATARETFGETLATGARPSINQIRAKIRVGHPRAKALREALVPA